MSDSPVLGTYRAVVVNNNDPQSGARVTLKVPQVLGDAESNWAVPAVPTSIVPNPGDLLWCSFEGGDITSPVYTPPGLRQLTDSIEGLEGSTFTGSPPKAPSGLSLTTAQVLSPEGVATSVVSATWTAPTENQDGTVPVKKLSGYRAQYSYDQTSWTGGAFTSETSWLFDSLRPGSTAYVRVQSLSSLSGPGLWSPSVYVTTDSAVGPSLGDLETSIGQTDSKAQDALDSANGKNKVTFSTDLPGAAENLVGDTWFQINADENVVSQWRGLGGTLWESVALSHEVMASIDAAKITVGLLRGDQMEAKSITADHLASVIAVISKLCSSETGRRWEADGDGIRLYDIDESLIVNLSTDPGTPASIAGDLVASSLTVSDQLAIRGLVNEISKGAMVTLSSGTSAPSSPPSVSLDWEYITTPEDDAFSPYRYGWTRVGDKYYYLQDIWGQNTAIQRYPVAGGTRDYFGQYSTQIRSGVGGVTSIGSKIYLLGREVDGTKWRVEEWETSGTLARTATWAWTAPSNLSDRAAIGTDGTNVIIGYSTTAGSVQWQVRNKTTGAQVGSTVTTNYTTTSGCVGVAMGNFDYGSTRVVMAFRDATSVVTFNSTGTRQTNDEWLLATGSAVNGLCWDTTLSRFVAHDAVAEKAYLYSAILWTTQSSTWWASTTWHDPDTTGGTHETAQGPRKSFTMKKRARLRITPPPMPVRPVPNTTDDVTASRIFIGRGSTDPGRTYMENVATTSATSYLLSSMTFPSGLAVNPPPAASDFPASSPAKIASAGGNFLVNGDGTGTWGAVTFGAASNSSTSVGGALTVSGQLSGQSVYSSDGNGGVLVAGTTTTQGEPSVRLRRQTSDGLHNTEGYFYVQAGTASGVSIQNRRDGSIVNQLILRDDGRTTLDGKYVPIHATGTGTPAAVAADAFWTTTVSFPAGRFSSAPRVAVSASSGRLNAAARAVTTSGFTLELYNCSNGASGSAESYQWIAIQE